MLNKPPAQVRRGRFVTLASYVCVAPFTSSALLSWSSAYAARGAGLFNPGISLVDGLHGAQIAAHIGVVEFG